MNSGAASSVIVEQKHAHGAQNKEPRHDRRRSTLNHVLQRNQGIASEWFKMVRGDALAKPV